MQKVLLRCTGQYRSSSGLKEGHLSQRLFDGEGIINGSLSHILTSIGQKMEQITEMREAAMKHEGTSGCKPQMSLSRAKSQLIPR